MTRGMARHSTRPAAPTAPAPDDVFVERVLETSVWAKQNARLLIIIGTIVVLLGGFLLYYRSYRSQLQVRAENELTAIRQTVSAGNDALAAKDLETFLAARGSSPEATEARVLLGRVYLDTNAAQKAIDLLTPVASDLKQPLGVSAAFLLAQAYEAAAQPDRAVEVYLRIGSGAMYDFEKLQALDAAARVRTEKGDYKGAIDVYDRLLGMLAPEAPDRQVYELRKAEAAARMQNASH